MTLSPANTVALAEYVTKHGTSDGFVPAKRRKRDNRESRLQKACVAWWRSAAAGLGYDHRLLYAVPNGAMYGVGVAKYIRAKNLLAEGLRVGWPDLGLDVARGGYHGLRIEMKLPETEPTPEQCVIHSLLIAQGYRVCVTRTLDQFTAAVTNYLSFSK